MIACHREIRGFYLLKGKMKKNKVSNVIEIVILMQLLFSRFQSLLFFFFSFYFTYYYLFQLLIARYAVIRTHL